MGFYVQKEKKANDLDGGELPRVPTDEFKAYTAATCLEGVDSLEKATDALRGQLEDVPELVREKVIRRVLVPESSQRGSTSDFEAKVATSGVASIYMAYWSTAYSGNEFALAPTYSTCVVVSGVNFNATEIIEGYKESNEPVLIGYKPCECGYMYCAGECPQYQDRTTKTPIFKRQALSLDEQENLHRWMVLKAVGSAENVLPARQYGESLDSGGHHDETVLPL